MCAMSPKLLRPRATGFNPRSIANLAAWYDATDSGSITIATGVQQWADKSGNSRHLIQNTTNNQPALVTNSLNGKPVLEFDGSNDALLASFTLAQPVTVFIVGRWMDVNSGTMFDGQTGNAMRFFRTGASNYAMFAGNPQLTSSNTSPATHAIHELIYNGATSDMIRNGTRVGASTSAGTSSATGISVGAFGNGTTDPAKCQVAHLLVYLRSLTSTERASVRKWLGNLYAITVA